MASANTLGVIYTNGTDDNPEFIKYNIEDLELNSALVRLDEKNDKNLKFTIAVVLDGPIETMVSKAKSDKIKPKKFSVGELFAFSVSLQLEKDGKKDGRAETLSKAFSIRDVKEGQIRIFTLDGGSIPAKGFTEKALKHSIEDEEGGILYIADIPDIEEDDSLNGLIKFISGVKVPRSYAAKKTPEEALNEKIALLEKIMMDSDGRIVKTISRLTGSKCEWVMETSIDDGKDIFYWKLGGTGLSFLASILD